LVVEEKKFTFFKIVAAFERQILERKRGEKKKQFGVKIASVGPTSQREEENWATARCQKKQATV